MMDIKSQIAPKGLEFKSNQFIISDKYIICNSKTALKLKSEYITDKKVINVKQGYTSCSVVCVNSDAYITDDENIYNTLSENYIDCLKIKKGDIIYTSFGSQNPKRFWEHF